MTQSKILLVDDDVSSLASTRKILELSGYVVVTAHDGQEALAIVRQESDLAVIVSDVRMPKLDGIEFLKALNALGMRIPVVLMTAYGEVPTAVWAMKMGALDFLSKPFKKTTLIEAVGRAVAQNTEKNAEKNGDRGATSIKAKRVGTTEWIGSGNSSQQVKKWVEQLAKSSASVLIVGDSGSGKEKVARLIHETGAQSAGQFVALNCAALPEHLIESELFGFEKGAFTNAVTTKPGLFEVAHRGTLFLDEIGDMPLSVQAKLLRVLQEGDVRRLGATESKKVQVRVISATHRKLDALVVSGQFREDLLYRLKVIEFSVPSLKSRAEDLPELVDHFLTEFSDSTLAGHRRRLQVSDDVLKILEAYSWPGNVRELRNIIERAVVLIPNERMTIELSELPESMVRSSGVEPNHWQRFQELTDGSQMIPIRIGTPLKEIEELMIRKTLEVTHGDKTMTAKLLGINQRTIYRKIEKREESAELDKPPEGPEL